jgi:hypothetical protein
VIVCGYSLATVFEKVTLYGKTCVKGNPGRDRNPSLVGNFYSPKKLAGVVRIQTESSCMKQNLSATEKILVSCISLRGRFYSICFLICLTKLSAKHQIESAMAEGYKIYSFSLVENSCK